MERKIYERSRTGYEQLISYTSGSKRDTSGYKVFWVVRDEIRAVNQIFEWFGRKYERFETRYVWLQILPADRTGYEWSTGYEQLISYTSGWKRDTSGCKFLWVVRDEIRAVNQIFERFQRIYERFEIRYVWLQILPADRTGYERLISYTRGAKRDSSG